MAVIVVDSGPLTATRLLRDIPEEQWLNLMRIRRDYMHVRLSHDCSCLVQFVDDAKIMYRVLGFKSVDDMIRDGYDLLPEEVNIALEWLRLNPPKEPMPLAVAQAAAMRARDAKDRENQRPVGTNQHSEPVYDEKSDIHRLRSSGTSTEAALRRLRKSRPELHAQVLAGEITANAAMVAAGFRKPRQPEPMPYLRRLRQIWALSSPEERQAFLDEVTSHQPTPQ